MDTMDNPYQSPESPFGPPPGPFPPPPYRRPGGLVRHVRVVAILMIVQGALETLAGVGLIVLAVVMPQIMTAEGMGGMPQRPPQGPPPEEFVWFILAIYGGMGLAALLAGVLHIVAGLRNYRFRGKKLGIFAACGGLIALITCYCMPTAIGVAVYGLVVLLNTEVSEAFAMGEAGYAPSDILAHYS